MPSHLKSARRARVIRWSRCDVTEKGRDWGALHNCFIHEVEEMREEHLNRGGMVDAPQ